MSGLNRTPGKRVYVSKRTAGSNPALSASNACDGRFFLPFSLVSTTHVVSPSIIWYYQISSFLVDRMKDAESCPGTHTASD